MICSLRHFGNGRNSLRVRNVSKSARVSKQKVFARKLFANAELRSGGYRGAARRGLRSFREHISRCGVNHTNPTTQTPPTGEVPRVTYQSISINAKESGIRLNSPVPSAWMSSGTSVWVRTASVMWQRALASERPGMRNTTVPVSVTSLLAA